MIQYLAPFAPIYIKILRDKSIAEYFPFLQQKNPIYLPGKCPAGELLYPGDQSDDWICDCRPGMLSCLLHTKSALVHKFELNLIEFSVGYIYDPMYDRCFATYTRGPCNYGRYIILPPNSVLPECVINSCIKENLVPFRGTCFRLNSSGPCPLPELGTVIGVNSTTLELVCISDEQFTSLFLGNRGTSDNSSEQLWPHDDCFIGGKRSYQGICAEKA